MTRLGRTILADFGVFSEFGDIVHKGFAEPDREFVERAIVRVLEIAQCQGITPEDFIQMLDSGMRISDFLNVAPVFTDGHTIGYTVKLDSAS